MVEITNGINTIKVPNGAYHSIFKAMGYSPIGHAEPNTSQVDQNGVSDPNAAFVAEVSQKPLSQWTKDEIKRYAAINNIDISGTKNPAEAKQIIKDHMLIHMED